VLLALRGSTFQVSKSRGNERAGVKSEIERDLLVALCDPSLDDETRQLMLTVAKVLHELIQASWPNEKAS